MSRKNTAYIKHPKISYTKFANKKAYANSADPDQTAPGAVWSESTLFASAQSILRNSCIKSKIYAKKVSNKIFKILGQLLYVIWTPMFPYNVHV